MTENHCFQFIYYYNKENIKNYLFYLVELPKNIQEHKIDDDDDDDCIIFSPEKTISSNSNNVSSKIFIKLETYVPISYLF